MSNGIGVRGIIRKVPVRTIHSMGVVRAMLPFWSLGSKRIRHLSQTEEQKLTILVPQKWRTAFVENKITKSAFVIMLLPLEYAFCNNWCCYNYYVVLCVGLYVSASHNFSISILPSICIRYSISLHTFYKMIVASETYSSVIWLGCSECVPFTLTTKHLQCPRSQHNWLQSF